MVHPCDKPCGNKTASGYCATTACINPQYSNFGTAQYQQGVQKCIVTNADRIRSMTDEELADKLEEIQLKTVKAYGNDDLLLKGELKKYWLDWLKEEAKE
jgi:hypothetical protein